MKKKPSIVACACKTQAYPWGSLAGINESQVLCPEEWHWSPTCGLHACIHAHTFMHTHFFKRFFNNKLFSTLIIVDPLKWWEHSNTALHRFYVNFSFPCSLCCPWMASWKPLVTTCGFLYWLSPLPPLSLLVNLTHVQPLFSHGILLNCGSFLHCHSQIPSQCPCLIQTCI